ncbi:hypothetical protein [Sphingomonas sp. LaA6.9]|uniref:hypothetical protein n=1 Tax=Sphingomonas sp. LaA6.9 TaxID=2919914 RepID=UPI001F4F5BA0|nr:hypothetical protein [Sphingomonas sp. LaA6.9]MCJ8156314.1 hypothetical protein [Sphingomonas sp. LaA6.9]
MTMSKRARTLADAQALMAQALILLDKAEALEAGAQLDAVIQRVNYLVGTTPIRLVHTR